MSREIVTLRNARTGTTFAAIFDRGPDAALDFLTSERASDYVIVACSDEVAWGLEAWAERDVVYCSLCDGVGHGQPGYGPCPLEERGWADGDR